MHTPTRDPNELTIHPALKNVPEWDKDDADFHALIESVREQGITHPLIIDESGRVLDLDSRALWRAAKRLQLAEVPVRVCADADAAGQIVAGLIQRRHFTKGARAYLVQPLLKEAFESSRRKRWENLKIGEKPNDLPKVPSGDFREGGPRTVEDFAERLGLERKLLFAAANVHKAFADPKEYEFTVEGGARDGEVVTCTLKEWFEPRLLAMGTGDEHDGNRPLGLGGVLKAIGSVKETKGKARGESKQLELFASDFNGTFFQLKKQGLDQVRARLRLYVAERVTSDEDLDLLDQFGAELRSIARERRKKLAGEKDPSP